MIEIFDLNIECLIFENLAKKSQLLSVCSDIKSIYVFTNKRTNQSVSLCVSVRLRVS